MIVKKIFLLAVLGALIFVTPLRPGDALLAYRLERSIRLGAEWLVRNQLENGLFRYDCSLEKGSCSRIQNLTRQAGGTWALAEAAYFFHDRKYFEAAARSVDYFVRISEVREADRRLIRSLPDPENGVTRNNAIALLLRAILALGREDPDFLKSHGEIAESFASHLLLSQTGEGLFPSRYAATSGYYSSANDDYNDGETFFALIGMYNTFPRPEYREAIFKAARALENQYGGSLNRKFYAWGMKGFKEFLALGSEPAYRDFIFQQTDLMLETPYFVFSESLPKTDLPQVAFLVFSEGVAEAYALAAESGELERKREYGDVLRKSIERIFSFQLTENKNLSEETYRRAYGGFCGSPACRTQRVDNTQHAVLALLRIYDSLR